MSDESRAPSLVSRSLPWLLLAAFWLAAVRVLQREWCVNPQYNYGWAVPVLCAWLFFERWRTRPAPGPRPPSGFGLAAGLAAIVVAWLPVRLVLEAFPDWRPVLWALGALLVALTLVLLHRMGGRAWLCHFAFPVGFFLAAIPWPTLVERPVLGGLLRLNTTLVADLLTLLGQPVLQRGNLIETARGLVGIDEACSGMRSLQASLMIALFMGEWFRLSPGRRVVFLIAGGLLAFAANLGRSAWLAWSAAHDGPAALAGRHDPAGVAAMVVCVVGLWCLHRLFRRSPPKWPPAAASDRGHAVPLWTGALLAAGLVVAEAGTEFWYCGHTPAEPAVPAWTINWPVARPAFRRLEIRPAVRDVLRIDLGAAAAWTAPDHSEWIVHWLRWEPRPVAQAILAQFHTPDVCLPAAGCLLRSETGPVPLETAAGTLLFRSYAFEEEGRPVFVFYLLREDREAGGPGLRRSLPLERLRLVWEGRRSTGQTALHVALRGVADESAAAAAFRREIAPLLGGR